MANLSKMIEISRGMKTSVRETVCEEEYEDICKLSNVFEYIPDDRPVKLYFDADHIFSENFEKYSDVVAMKILRIHLHHLSSAIFQLYLPDEPIFSVAESHSKRRLKNGKEVWGYSFHIVVTNIIAYKKDQRSIVDKLNKLVRELQSNARYHHQFQRDRDVVLCNSLYTTCESMMEGMVNAFDTSVYNTGQQKIRALYSSKDGEDRPFNLVKYDEIIFTDNKHSMTFNDMVITGFISENAMLYVPFVDEDEVETEKKSISKPDVEMDEEMVSKYIDYAEICDLRVFQHDYNKYYKFSRASANLGVPFYIFDNIVKKPEAGNYDYDKNLIMYETPHNESKCKLGWRFIYAFAKESDSKKKAELDVKYEAICRKKKKDEKMEMKKSLLDDVEESDNLVGICDGDESGAAKVILLNHPDWIYCNQILYVHNQETGMWSNNRCVQDLIISKYADQLDILSQNRKKKTGKNYSHCTKKCADLYPKLKQFTLDDNWVERTENSSRGYLLYKNGYYDLKKNKFYDSKTNKYDAEIVFIYRIDHDYIKPNQEDLQYMETIRQRIFFLSLGEEQGQYLLELIARGISGEKMKRIFFGLGPSNSGKSIISKAISLSCGQYVGNFNAENLALSNSSGDEAQRLRWAYLLKDKRIILSNEMTTKGKIDGNMVKKISSGGDTLIGRVHGGCETQYVPQFFAIIFANDIPVIEPYDDGVDKRTIIGSFNKCFVLEPKHELELEKDDKLENEMVTLKFQQAFVNLLVKTYITYVQEDSFDYIPEEIHQSKMDWLGVNSSKNDQRFSAILEFTNKFELTNNEDDFTVSSEILLWINMNAKGISSKKFIIEMKKYCLLQDYTNIVSKKKSINGSKCSGWVGIRNIDSVEKPDANV